MYTTMTSSLSLLLLALIPATIAAPPPSSSVVAPPVATPTGVAGPVASGAGQCPHSTYPTFPAPVDLKGAMTCTTEGSKACSIDETTVVVCTGGKWVPTNCGQKEGYQLACRSYAKSVIDSKGCSSYGDVYSECTGYEDADVHETVSSEVGWDAQYKPTAAPAPAGSSAAPAPVVPSSSAAPAPVVTPASSAPAVAPTATGAAH